MQEQLHPGTVLDGRYRIDAVLGQGGFGITYAAQNTRIGMKVALKELFWRGHSVRKEEASPEVALAYAADASVFEEQKRRFLEEARTIRDFSGQSGVVRILDYFEANATAYIVMEYVEGETLAAMTARNALPCEELLRRFLPLIDTLAAIHRTGIIHRDISPDNVMVQTDGSLKLIDFGAARQYMDRDQRYTTISRDSYSPGEQYDKNGRQGPWTDVYALCATLYACVCGSPPPSAVQRMFLDELQPPSAMGIDIAPAYEAIIMKGLQVRQEKRWQDMGELAAAIRSALPEEKAPTHNRRSLLIGLLAGLLCVGVALGIWGWHRYDITHRFRGIETEQIRFMATEDTTAAEFAAAPDELRKRLEDFVGPDGYLLEVDGASMKLTLPLSAFEGQEIWEVIKQRFSKLVPEKGTNIVFEYKSNWEDPAQTMTAGENQVLPEALEGETAILRFDWNSQLTRGQRANLIVDFKVRLDALGVPYAFGTTYGNTDSIMVRIGMDRMGEPIYNPIGSGGYPIKFATQTSEWSYAPSVMSSMLQTMTPFEAEGGTIGLRFTTQYDNEIEDLEAYTRAILEYGMNRIYLVDTEGNPIAYATLSAPVSDGTLEFRDFCLADHASLTSEDLWLLDYYATLVNKTDLPTSCSLNGLQYVDADGHVPLAAMELPFDISYAPMDSATEQREQLEAIRDQFGFKMTEGSDFWLLLDLPLDDSLPGEISARVPSLLEAIFESGMPLQKGINLLLTEEREDVDDTLNRCRIILDQSYDTLEDRFYNTCYLFVSGSDLEPWRTEIKRWWDEFDLSPYGAEKGSI